MLIVFDLLLSNNETSECFCGQQELDSEVILLSHAQFYVCCLFLFNANYIFLEF